MYVRECIYEARIGQANPSHLFVAYDQIASETYLPSSFGQPIAKHFRFEGLEKFCVKYSYIVLTKTGCGLNLDNGPNHLMQNRRHFSGSEDHISGPRSKTATTIALSQF